MKNRNIKIVGAAAVSGLVSVGSANALVAALGIDTADISTAVLAACTVCIGLFLAPMGFALVKKIMGKTGG